MTHFYDLAARRRSMRQFTEQSLTQDELAALIGTALMAPSSKGTCCCRRCGVAGAVGRM